MTIFEQIKSSTDIKQVAQHYGIKIRRNKAHCPFHKDEAPSMGFKQNRFNCFSCGKKGSSIDLVSELLSCNLIDAAKSINDSFNLNLEFGGKITTQEMNNIQNILKEKKIQREALQEKNKQSDIYFKEILHKHYDLRKQAPSDEFWDNLKILRKLEDDYFGKL